MSGQQTSSLFSGGFMIGQFEQDTLNENIEDKSDTHGYDMVGNAKLNSVLEVIKIKRIGVLNKKTLLPFTYSISILCSILYKSKLYF